MGTLGIFSTRASLASAPTSALRPLPRENQTWGGFFSAVWIFLFFYQSVVVAMQMRFIRTCNATEEQLFLASRTVLSVVSHPCAPRHMWVFFLLKNARLQYTRDTNLLFANYNQLNKTISGIWHKMWDLTIPPKNFGVHHIKPNLVQTLDLPKKT